MSKLASDPLNVILNILIAIFGIMALVFIIQTVEIATGPIQGRHGYNPQYMVQVREKFHISVYDRIDLSLNHIEKNLERTEETMADIERKLGMLLYNEYQWMHDR